MTNKKIKNESSLRDLNKFPACVTDEDCELIEDNENSEYRCFQYMCYPWAKKGPFRSCQRKHDCKDLTPEEGANGERVDCFRHLDRRRVLRGICLVKSKTKRCSEHSECSTDLKCVAGYCGDPQYFEEIKQFSCEGDNFCEVNSWKFKTEANSSFYRIFFLVTIVAQISLHWALKQHWILVRDAAVTLLRLLCLREMFLTMRLLW